MKLISPQKQHPWLPLLVHLLASFGLLFRLACFPRRARVRTCFLGSKAAFSLPREIERERDQMLKRFPSVFDPWLHDCTENSWNYKISFLHALPSNFSAFSTSSIHGYLMTCFVQMHAPGLKPRLLDVPAALETDTRVSISKEAVLSNRFVTLLSRLCQRRDGHSRGPLWAQPS